MANNAFDLNHRAFTDHVVLEMKNMLEKEWGLVNSQAAYSFLRSKMQEIGITHTFNIDAMIRMYVLQYLCELIQRQTLELQMNVAQHRNPTNFMDTLAIRMDLTINDPIVGRYKYQTT